MATDVISGSSSDTTTEDEDSVARVCRGRPHESPFMFLEIPFEQQKTLFDAIRVHDAKKVQKIVDEQPISLKWRHFIHSPLGLSCCLDQDDVVLYFLQKIQENAKTLRCEVNYQDRKGWTPIMYAAINGNAQLVERLCAAGARVNCKDRLRWTPLAYASYNGHVDVVKILLETDNIDLHLVDEKNTTVLHCLAKQRDVDLFDDITTTAEMILEHDQSIIDCKTARGKTALHEACKQHNPSLVAVLLKFGSKVNSKDDQDQTPIFYVFHGVPGCGRRMIDCLRLLLTAPNIRLNLRDSYSLAPIHLATLEGDVRAVTTLVQAGADWKVADRSKRWPIHYAARDQQLGIIELLLKKDNTNQVNAISWCDISTPLTELLSHCADINPNQNLILSCVKVLLRYGADVSVPNAFLNTPIDLAAEASLWSVTRLLVLAGAYYNFEILHGCLERAAKRIEAEGDGHIGPGDAAPESAAPFADPHGVRPAMDEAVDDDSDTDNDNGSEGDLEFLSVGLRHLVDSGDENDHHDPRADDEGFQWCHDFAWGQPISLMNAARIRVRRSLAQNIVALIADYNLLPLPSPIVEFVLLKDEMENLFF